MKMIEKLALLQSTKGLVLFTEGFFYRAYNDSCYILTQLLNMDLTVQYKHIAELDNQLVVMCGFPQFTLNEKLPNAILTDYGAIVLDKFDLSGYQDWFVPFVNQPISYRPQRVALNDGDNMPSLRATQIINDEQLLHLLQSLFNHKQLDYLINWQKHRYSLETEQRFIESLQRKVVTLINN